MNLSYQFDVTSIRSELIPIRSPLFGLVLGGLLLMSGCASTQSYRTSCPVASETVAATQSQAEAGGAASQYQIGLWRSGPRQLDSKSRIISVFLLS